MQLYAGTSKQFIDDTTQHRISEKLKEEFFRQYRYKAPDGEYRSWRNSLAEMCFVMMRANLDDHGVILEYQLPLSSKRLDCMLMGKGNDGDNAIIVELKQWENAVHCDAEKCVTTFVGGKLRDVLHPSVQVGQYQQYLADCHTVFSEGDVNLEACAFLHNFEKDASNELFASKHEYALHHFPLFCRDQSQELVDHLAQRMPKGDGQRILANVQESRYRPSKKLLDHTSQMVSGQKAFVLLDDQLVVFESVLAEIKKSFHDKQKVVLLVRGGPGTGKSVIALHVVGELSKLQYNAQHATGSKAFTGNIKKLVGSRAAAQFKFFNSYAQADNNDIDVLILDEAHRLRPDSTNRFTPKDKRSGMSQVDELVAAAKVSVFFIDDLQVVRPKEVGSSDLIRESAQRSSAKLKEFELDVQFRCGGSDGFINWIDNTLGIRKTANVLWEGTEGFDFQVVDTVESLEQMIRQRSSEGFTARLTAGFCWPWSDPKKDGSLVTDVVVGDWQMPWNAKPDSGSLAPGIPTSDFWASSPNGIHQVGCVYTAQGFEFDYAGVIIGRDLRYDLRNGEWIGDKTQSHDSIVKRSGDQFLDLIRNTYRVLLTRGVKGCYVHFMDDDTRAFWLSRTETRRGYARPRSEMLIAAEERKGYDASGKSQNSSEPDK
ncbi:MAG: DUF2075 domain-containing protein [Chlorobia bacterium]|nr:DUF2075 domain-containing protein [Fimbriimonadaceae bacterium]